MPIVWKPEMAVGNTVIDDEHKLLICLINSVEIALKAPDHVNMIRFLVKELHLYTRNHFSQEERMMFDAKYQGYMKHKMEHQKILSQIEELEENLAKAVAHAEAKKNQDSDAKSADSETTDSESTEVILIEEEQEDEFSMLEQDIIGLLRSWIVDHVLEFDMKLKNVV